MFKKTLLAILATSALAMAQENDTSDSFFYTSAGMNHNEPIPAQGEPQAKGNFNVPIITAGYRIKGNYVGLDLSASGIYNDVKWIVPDANIYALFYPMGNGLYLGAGANLADTMAGMQSDEGVDIRQIARGAIGYEFKSDSGKTRFVQLTGSSRHNVTLQAGIGF